MLEANEAQIAWREASDLATIWVRRRLAWARGGCTRTGHGPARFEVITRYRDYCLSPSGITIGGYRYLSGMLPLRCGVDQVLIPAPESGPALSCLNAMLPSLALNFTSSKFENLFVRRPISRLTITTKWVERISQNAPGEMVSAPGNDLNGCSRER
jgi:hypothetical protein